LGDVISWAMSTPLWSILISNTAVCDSVYEMIEGLCEQKTAVSAVLRYRLHLEHSPADCRLLEDYQGFKTMDTTTYLSASRCPTILILGPVSMKSLLL